MPSGAAQIYATRFDDAASGGIERCAVRIPAISDDCHARRHLRTSFAVIMTTSPPASFEPRPLAAISQNASTYWRKRTSVARGGEATESRARLETMTVFMSAPKRTSMRPDLSRAFRLAVTTSCGTFISFEPASPLSRSLRCMNCCRPVLLPLKVRDQHKDTLTSVNSTSFAVRQLMELGGMTACVGTRCPRADGSAGRL